MVFDIISIPSYIVLIFSSFFPFLFLLYLLCCFAVALSLLNSIVVTSCKYNWLIFIFNFSPNSLLPRLIAYPCSAIQWVSLFNSSLLECCEITTLFLFHPYPFSFGNPPFLSMVGTLCGQVFNRNTHKLFNPLHINECSNVMCRHASSAAAVYISYSHSICILHLLFTLFCFIVFMLTDSIILLLCSVPFSFRYFTPHPEGNRTLLSIIVSKSNLSHLSLPSHYWYWSFNAPFLLLFLLSWTSHFSIPSFCWPFLLRNFIAHFICVDRMVRTVLWSLFDELASGWSGHSIHFDLFAVSFFFCLGFNLSAQRNLYVLQCCSWWSNLLSNLWWKLSSAERNLISIVVVVFPSQCTYLSITSNYRHSYEGSSFP